jgi:hypothetical protein
MRLIFDSVAVKIGVDSEDRKPVDCCEPDGAGPLAYALLESFLIVSLYIVCETSSSLFDVSVNYLVDRR